MLEKLYQKAFLGGRYFTIAIRKKTKNESILDSLSFSADHLIPASYSKWYADPILIDDKDKTYLFYEAVSNSKGRLEVAEVFNDGRISEPTVLLETRYHYSYPFVFQMNEEWYMIPESSEEEQVRLYKAETFPFKWQLQQVLLNTRSVDTTIFEADGKRYLLTFVLQPKNEKVTPRCFQMDVDCGIVRLSELAWNDYEPLRVRGAGPVFTYQGKNYRPYQISRENIYGDAVGFSEISVLEDGLKERTIAELLAKNVSIPSGKWFDGLHTYSCSKQFEAIDVRCRDFDLFKLGKTASRKIIQKVKRNVKHV